jgi:CRP/FNR family transcriptional regulator
MASSARSLEPQTRPDYVVAHFPASRPKRYRKGQEIYGPRDRSRTIYLVVAGKVGISHIAGDGSQVLLEIVRPNELFGELACLDAPPLSEKATAIEEAKLMTWGISDMEDLVVQRPRLALALLQVLAQRNVELTRRIESFAIDTIERRLARSLIHLAERLGTPEEDGAVKMMPLTHEMLSHYIGTAREVVTLHMNRFRKQGYVDYSRRGMLLHGDALKASIS